MPLVLASSSPRRLALLRQAAIEPTEIFAPDVDEAIQPNELPRAYAVRMAENKLGAALVQCAGAFVLAADTVVACGRRILDKTDDPSSAEATLRLLSGRRHRVTTAVAVGAPDGRRSVKAAMTHVRFKRLDRRELDAYLRSEEWRGKAGAYAIQGLAETFVLDLNGSYSNVVGLPLALTVNILRGLGWQPP